MAERTLGRAVGDEPAVAQAADGGGDVDDRPFVARVEQMRRRGLAEHERSRDVEVERPLEESGARVEKRTRHRATRVVDDDVEPAQLLHGARDDVDDRVVVVDVGRQHDRLPAEPTNIGRDLVELFLRAGREHDVGTRVRERAGDLGADSTAGAGDDRDLAVEPERVEPGRGCRRHDRYRETVSTIAAGFSAPSRSMVTRVTACTPPGTSLASITSPRPRNRDPTGTGAGKRTFSAP